MKAILTSLFSLVTFISFSQPNTEVFLFDIVSNNENLELSNFKNISENEGYDNQPSFMDDNTILYAGTRNGQTDIIKYNLTYGSKTWICFTEGGEYSPLKIPNQNAVSAIRLDPDGKQLLYCYDLKNGKNKAIMDTLVVGYHTWFDKNTVVSSVLEADYLALYATNVTSHKNQKMDDNIGRSLHKIPNTKLVSYISKKMDSIWMIKSLNPITGETKPLTKTLPLIEDMCWLNDGSVLMAKDGILFRNQPKMKPTWKQIASLKDFGINNITRLAVSPNGTKLAVVGELANQKLEPKLENIKWIAGNWKGEAFGGLTEENWSEPSGGSMMATFKLINHGNVSFYEIEIIREVENSLILQLKHFDNELKGWETKDETVDFPLKEITANKVVFEGMTFEKISDSEMNVYVDIHQDNGKIETVTFNYKKSNESSSMITKKEKPEAIVQLQLDAYNARDIDAFMATYSDNVKLYQFPETLISEGQEAMRKNYTTMFANTPNLFCEIKKRIVMGNKVIDHEYVLKNDTYINAIAIYEVENGLISKVTFIK